MAMIKNFDTEKTILLIDGSSFLYRAYYALKPMHTIQGQAIHAVYGFCRMIKKLLADFKPSYCVIAWDSPAKTYRAQVYTEYKATRQAAPADLGEQKLLIKEFADLIGIHQLELAGVEADDLLYSAAMLFKEHGFTPVLVTTDKDLGQVVGDTIVMYDSFKDAIITRQDLEARYGFAVEKLPFYFSLIGDSSDNIPGVHGIGPKTAQDLVKQFDSLEDLYAHIDRVPKERIRQLLLDHREDAFLSLDLFKLRQYPLPLTVQDAYYAAENWQRARPFFEKLGFKSLLKDMEGSEPQQKATIAHRASFKAITITTCEHLQTLMRDIKAAGAVGVDTETDGLSPMQAHLVGLSLCVQKDTSYYIPCAHLQGAQLSCTEIKELLAPIMADPSIKKYMHNAKYDLHILHNAGMPVRGLAEDTLIAASLVTPDWQRIGLKYLSEHYLGEAMLSYSDVVTKNGYSNFTQVPLDLATRYAASDAHQTWALVDILEKELREHQQETLYRAIEFPIIELLTKMERDGIYCDATVLADLDKTVSVDIVRIREHIIDLIGEHHAKINLNSPKQLAVLLFDELKLTPVKKTGKKESYSTDQEVLQELAKDHPVPALIVKYREFFKLKSTYIDALPGFINDTTGRIHTTFSQIAAATGRLASYDPNMQNIPPVIRTAFKPAPGYSFLSADYSQIELRVLAYLSQDPVLCGAFNRGEDIHSRTAAGLFDCSIKEVTPEQRQVAKRINFSILYGMTPFGLSKDLDIPFATAKEYIHKFMSQYQGVQTWMEEVVQEAKNFGYVTTHWGRRRYVPGIYEKNKSLYELARRVAINTKGQGTAAELMKLGMLNVQKSLQHLNLNAKMILQIHDELLLEVPDAQLQATEKLVKATLESVVTWNIPLVATTRTGLDWYEVSK